MAVIATALNYLIGDLLILPGAGNVIASIADGGLGALVAYVVSLISPVFMINANSLIIFIVLVAIGEYLFHKYLKRHEEVAP